MGVEGWRGEVETVDDQFYSLHGEIYSDQVFRIIRRQWDLRLARNVHTGLQVSCSRGAVICCLLDEAVAEK